MLLAQGCSREPKFQDIDFPYRHLAEDTTHFYQGVPVGVITTDSLTEASGLAASMQYPGVLWSHNDSQNQPQLFAFDTLGRALATYTLVAPNQDWEAMAAGPGPDSTYSYLYLADIGDNQAQYPYVTIYRLREPDPAQPTSGALAVDSFRYTYPDGPRDAETFLVDPVLGDWLIVTKREDSVRVYSLPHDSLTTGQQVAAFRLAIPMRGVSDGSVSPNGHAVLLRTYDQLFFFQREGQEPLWETLARVPKRISYLPEDGMEPQGEAISWAADGADFFTVSEEYKEIPAQLYRYRKRR